MPGVLFKKIGILRIQFWQNGKIVTNTLYKNEQIIIGNLYQESIPNYDLLN